MYASQHHLPTPFFNLGISLFLNFNEPTNPSFFIVELHNVFRVEMILNHITLYRSGKRMGAIISPCVTHRGIKCNILYPLAIQ